MRQLKLDNVRTRRQAEAFRKVGPYVVHLSPVDRRIKAAVSRSGKVVHRCTDIDAGVAWAADRIQIKENKETP